MVMFSCTNSIHNLPTVTHMENPYQLYVTDIHTCINNTILIQTLVQLGK